MKSSSIGYPQILTDTAIRNAKPREKAYKLFDANGLFLLISPTGFKPWRYKYRFNKKERLLTIGKYRVASGKSAGFTLQEARKEHAIAYALIQQGIDPTGWKPMKGIGRVLKKFVLMKVEHIALSM